MMAGVGCGEVVVFEDLFPAMVESLGTEGFMKELCDGFRLLAEEEKGVITFESLKKKSSAILGLPMSDEEVRCMLKEGDMDGDGCLNKMEFCVLMFRLSPDLMNKSRLWLIAADRSSPPSTL
ncbi:PREDICTED: calcium-binding protein PBP1-like [Ipomoea nil]|uniref:calcium-binding protein PBP1-like n=1 Tax=Ipomoea nil TaxID=35883 RepID=UPI0009010758|nr:PREDICTED: calcium-binding protein PBP1-like [Ipomoea nil]